MHATGEQRKWMINELDIMNHLRHKNIIRPYDSLLSTKSYTIMQELYPFNDLLIFKKNYINIDEKVQVYSHNICAFLCIKTCMMN